MYALEVKAGVDRTFRRMAKKDRDRLEAVEKKVREIVEEPHRFKPLRAPMQNKRRVHIGPFVLVYKVDEERKVVILLDFEHHDTVYRR
jgi:YafQ family addiction module toxin component